jgi:hypothetical protein
MSFKQNKYQVIKQAVSFELVNFCFNYFLLKRDAIKYLTENNLIARNIMHGRWDDEQVPGAYSIYGDHVMETMLINVIPNMKEKTGLDLVPTYSYARIYEKGHKLDRHKDRHSCEISTTLNLGGDIWPIYLEPSGQVGKEGIKIELSPGDMLIYSGCELEHWREPFEGNLCAQVFLHYNHLNGPLGKQNIYDKRPLLGLPNLGK